jgi:capsular exopolysaccharide synthesis family protein
MELARYLRLIRNRFWVVIALPVLAAVAAGVVSILLPPVYEAHVSVYVRLAQPLTSNDPTGVSLTSGTVLQTYADMTKEPALLQRVINELGLNMSPDELAKEVTATPLPNSTKLAVAVQDTNPAQARDVANKVVADLIAEVNQFQQEASQVPNSAPPDNLFVLSPAVLPDKPTSPNVTLNIAIAFAAGLFVALGGIILIDYLDQSITSDDELTERLGITTLGHVGYLPAPKGAKPNDLVSLDEQSPSVEAYKALRTSVLFSGVEKVLHDIVVTSAEPGEGKSRTAANLAVALAHAGHRTLLLDADFRRPSQHRIFGKVKNVGLANLILDDVSEAEAITAAATVPNLWVLTSGPTPPNPSELLGSGRMKQLVQKFRENFSYVVMDTPPVNAVTDATILAAHASATILVVEQGRTTFPALGRAKRMLDRVGAHVIGAVMNKVRATSGEYAYEYRYYGASDETDGNGLGPRSRRSRAKTTSASS